MSKPRTLGNNARARVREADRLLEQASTAARSALDDIDRGSLLQVGKLIGKAFGNINLARIEIGKVERGE